MMDRRDLILAFGTASAALLIAPEDARAAWARLAADGRPIRSRQLTPAQLALVAAVADTIIPRADTPGAVDVGVPAFVEAVVDASWPEDDRATFTAGLDALQSRLGGTSGSAPGARGDAIDAIEGEVDRGAEPVRTYWRLKSLIVHGYFTSEPVMKDVLHVQVIPGRFDGAAPMRAVRAPSQSTGAPHHG